MAVHARTLEFYRQFGFADEVFAAGVPAGAMHLREWRRSGVVEIARVDFSDMGAGLSAYPFALAYPQDLHERLLIDKLAAAGGRVEWNTRLTGVTQDGTGVRATLVGADGVAEQVEADWLAGCDGGTQRRPSRARHRLSGRQLRSALLRRRRPGRGRGSIATSPSRSAPTCSRCGCRCARRGCSG